MHYGYPYAPDYLHPGPGQRPGLQSGSSMTNDKDGPVHRIARMTPGFRANVRTNELNSVCAIDLHWTEVLVHFRSNCMSTSRSRG